MSESITVSFDLESSSLCDLKAEGARLYALHPSTRVLLFAWHVIGDPEPPSLWFAGDPFPARFAQLIASGARISGWNVLNFDRAVWREAGVVKHGFPPVSDDAWLDSMHTAAAANLPRSLAGACKATGVPFEANLKDDGEIRRITDQNRTPVPSRADLDWLAARCVQDVEMEEACLLKMPPWPQVAPWVNMPKVDRRINDRGVLMDVPLVEGLAQAAAIETERLNGEMYKLTKGKVPKTTLVEKLKVWLMERGVTLPLKAIVEKDEDAQQDADMADARERESESESDVEAAELDLNSPKSYCLRKSDIADIIARTDVPDECRQALLWRAEAAKASAKKLAAMLRSMGADGRLRGALVLGGAQATLRWSGAVWQPHNFVRDTIGNLDEVAEQNGLSLKADYTEVQRLSALCVRTAVMAGRSGSPATIEALFGMQRRDLQGRAYYDGVLPFVSRMLRRTLAAPQGHLLLNGDFANIEARIPVWLAGQQDMVEAFRRGDDVYRIAASPVYGKPPDKLTKRERQIGKVMVLFLGFAGGVNAFIPAAMNYGLSIDRDTGAGIVKTFRETNTALVAFWDANLDCAVRAVRYPGYEFPVPPLGIVSWYMLGNALHCRLPSGRCLRYWAPRMEQGFWDDAKTQPKSKLDLTVLSVKGRRVYRRTLWRGLATENITQAIAADLLAHALDNMDRHGGLPVVLHVHDNAVAEVPETAANRLLPEFKHAMVDAPAWAAGLPLDVAAASEARFS